jgi:hypothetical protein
LPHWAAIHGPFPTAPHYIPRREISSALFFLWLGLGRGARESLARGGFDNDGKPDLVLSTGSSVLTYPQSAATTTCPAALGLTRVVIDVSRGKLAFSR